MKITRMKNESGLSLKNLSEMLEVKLFKKGFITNVSLESGKIGMHMKSFTIDTSKLGYNAIVGSRINSKKGYKRTNTPLWEQREEFNHIINNFFNYHDITAKIVSGPYLIRDHLQGAVKEWECVNYFGESATPDVTYNGMYQEIDRRMTEKEALEYLGLE